MIVSTHSERLERWLGKEEVKNISKNMLTWYGPPIAVHGVPGAVYATGGGNFIGKIDVGYECSAMDRAEDIIRQTNRNRFARAAMSRKQLGAFGSLSALISAATGGKRNDYYFNKVGTASNAIGNAMSLFRVGAMPVAGANSAAAPGGSSPTSATVGAVGFNNPSSANTAHFVTGYAMASVISNTLMIYDRLYSVPVVMANTAAQGVTGQTTGRYQGTAAGAAAYSGGNFVFPEIGVVLPATAHNWTVCKYTNQAGVAGQSIPSIAGISAAVVNAVDLAAQSWFMPLATGDTGVQKLTQVQSSASIATGYIEFVVGHPIAFFPCPIAQMICIVDGINTAFNLAPILDNACLSFLEMPKPAVTATTYNGSITVVSE